MKKFTFWLLALLLTSGAFAQITTTTNVGRIPVAHPDLGHQGGSALHTKVANMWTAVSNHIDSRYFEFSLANGANTDLTHNFQTTFADVGYLLYWRDSGTGELTLITDTTGPSSCAAGAPPLSEFTIAGGPDITDQIRVTNNTGETCNLAILITQQDIKYTLFDLNDVLISSPTNRQGLFYDTSSSKWINVSLATVSNTASVGIGLNDLNDVVLTATATGDFTRYNGTNWVNTQLPAATNTAGATGVGQTDLNDTVISAPASNQVMRYSGTQWENANSSTIANTAGTTGIGQTDLNDTVITSAANGDILRHNGTNWVDELLSTVTNSAAPVGVALDNLNDVNAPSPDDGQALVWSDTNNDWRPGASGDASFKIQDVTHPNAIIKGGTMQGKDRRQFRTWDGGGSDETDFGTDLTCDLTAINPTPTNAAIYYIYIDLPGAQNGSTVITQSKQRVYPITCADIGLAGTNFSSPEGPEGLEFDSVPAVGFQREFIGWVRTADSGNTYSGTNSRFGTLAFRQLAQPEYNNPEGRSYNFLRNMNFNFEHSSNGDTSVMGWTATGLAITVTNSGNEKLQGTMALKVNSSATDQTLQIGTSEAQQPAFLDKNCLIRFNYKFDGGDISDYKVTVLDNATELFTPVGITPTSVSSAAAPVFQAGFTCPAAPTGELTFQIKSDGNNGDLFIDQVYLGLDDRIGSQTDGAEMIAQAFYGATANCTWTLDSASEAAFPIDADCPALTAVVNKVGSVLDTTSTGTRPQIAFSSLPAGIYEVEAQLSIAHTESTSFRNAAFSVSDSTTAGSGTRGHRYVASLANDHVRNAITITGVFEYTGSPAARTFYIQGAEDSTGSIQIFNSNSTTARQNLTWTVKRLPNQSPRDTVTLETQGWFLDTIISGVNISLGAGNDAGVFNTVEHGSLTLSHPSGSKSATARIPCAAPNPSTGTTCAVGNERYGVAFDAPYSGQYLAVATFTHEVTVDSTEIIDQKFKIQKTSDTSDAAAADGSRSSYASTMTGAATMNNTFIVTLSEVFYLDAGRNALKVFESTSIAGTPNLNQLRCNGGADERCTFKVYPITQQFPQAIALNNIETGAPSTGCANGNLCSSTAYSATVTSVLNFSAASTSNQLFSRNGNHAKVWGSIDSFTCTGGSASSVRVTLPIAASATTNHLTNLGGGGASTNTAFNGGTSAVHVSGGTTSSNAQLNWTCVTSTATSNTLNYVIEYRIQ